MADDDKEPALPISSLQQPQSTLHLDRTWEPMRSRNNVLLDSQPPFVPTPYQGVGMAGATRTGLQGSGTLSLTFADKEAVETWLRDQLDDVAVVFAARAALRVLPAFSLQPTAGLGPRTSRILLLQVFRAVATAWAVATFPSRRYDLNNLARAALSGLGNVKAQVVVRAAAYACATATGEPGSVTRASTVVGYSLDAAASRGRYAFESLLAAFATDASVLGLGHSTVTLANSKLWPDPTPDWVSESWHELVSPLRSVPEYWDVWINWYEERIRGVFSNADTEIARLTLDDWSRIPPEPEVINRLIADLLPYFQEPQSEAQHSPDLNAIPRQITNSSQFYIDAQGRVDLVPDPPVADNLQGQIYQEVRYKARALIALGHNQLADVSEPIDRFLAAVPERIENASINRLWSRGNTLRRRLSAHQIASDSADVADPALLPASVAEMLSDLVETYNVFIVGDPTGRELDRARLGPQERNEVKEVVEAAAPIVEAVRTSEGLATAAAIEALSEQMESARNAPSGVDGDQAIDQSRKTSTNFVVATLRSAYALIRAESGFAWKEVRAGGYRAVGAVAVTSGPIIAFVANNAEALKIFVEKAFHNPTLIQIIEFISKIGSVGP